MSSKQTIRLDLDGQTVELQISARLIGQALPRQGINRLERIVIPGPGQTRQFYLAGLDKPLTNRQKAEILIRCFDSALGLTAADLDRAGVLTPAGVVVEWAKEGRFYNIKKVRLEGKEG